MTSAVTKEISSQELPTELEDPDPIFIWDATKENSQARKKARKSIKVLISSIVPSNFLDSSYIQDKLEQDADQLGKLFCQQKSLEVVQAAEMNAIGKGNLSPRMFETITMISKNHSDISKQISEFQNQLRKNYIDIVLDLKHKTEEEEMLQAGGLKQQKLIENKEEDKFKNVFVGSNELLEKLHQKKLEKHSKEVEEAEFKEEDS